MAQFSPRMPIPHNCSITSGIVVILDPRVLTKSYGQAFLRALPQCPVQVL